MSLPFVAVGLEDEPFIALHAVKPNGTINTDPPRDFGSGLPVVGIFYALQSPRDGRIYALTVNREIIQIDENSGLYLKTVAPVAAGIGFNFDDQVGLIKAISSKLQELIESGAAAAIQKISQPAKLLGAS